MKISRKAAGVGFEWENVEGVWEKFHEELGEFEQALQAEPKENQQAELGDLLFTIVNLARWYDLDPEEALRGTNDRFIQRFSQVEQALGGGRSLADYTLEELEQLWQQAKANLKQG
jgi:XTP/dITP diphosphohydrolase